MAICDDRLAVIGEQGAPIKLRRTKECNANNDKRGHIAQENAIPITYSESDFFDLVMGEEAFGAIPKYKILVEGDSWVSHPFLRNLTVQIDDLGDDEFAILNLASPGDTAGRMFSGGRKRSKQLKRIGQLIEDKVHGYEFDLIFLSAGGNDIVGEEIKEFVDRYEAGGPIGGDLVNARFEGMLGEVVKGYENLISIRDKSKANTDTPIVCHCYSYLKPRKVGTRVFGVMFHEGWVKRYLDKKDIPKAQQQEVINTMLDKFYESLKRLEKKYDNFVVVDTREALLKSGRPNVSLFHDEIHPKGKGFRKVAKLIRSESIKRGVWPA